MVEDDDSATELKVNLEDILDLNVLDILILVYALVFANNSPVRFTLFQDLNSFLSNQPQKTQIQKSSFYNSIKKLKKKGLVKITTKNGKELLQASIQARDVMTNLNNLVITSIYNKNEFRNQIIEPILSELKINKVKSMLVLSFDEMAIIPIIKTLLTSSIVENYFVLTDKETFRRHFDDDSEKIKMSSILDQKIREPNNAFDLALIFRYKPSIGLYDLTPNQILEEIIRVTKPLQPIVLVSYGVFKKTGNFLLDKMAELISKHPRFFSVSKKELIDKMKIAGLLNVNVIEIEGVVIGWGQVPDKRES